MFGNTWKQSTIPAQKYGTQFLMHRIQHIRPSPRTLLITWPGMNLSSTRQLGAKNALSARSACVLTAPAITLARLVRDGKGVAGARIQGFVNQVGKSVLAMVNAPTTTTIGCGGLKIARLLAAAAHTLALDG